MIQPISSIIRGKKGVNSVTVGIIGDISFHNIKPSVDIFFPLLPSIRNTDLVIANIETVISDKKNLTQKKKGIFLKSPAESAKVLKELGVDIALLANNHIDDYGEDGIIDTMHHLNKKDILFFGINTRQTLIVQVKGISFEMRGFVTPYESTEFLSPYGDGLDNISEILPNDEVHLLYFLHGFDELFSVPFPWRVKLLRKICNKCMPSALICGHQHIYQGYYMCNDIPVCLSYGNGFMNIDYHSINPDSFIGCYSVLHFDCIGCFQIDEYYYQITKDRIMELSNVKPQNDRVAIGINTIKSGGIRDWENECFISFNSHRYNKHLLINLLYDIYRFFRQLRKYPKYIHYRSMLNSYIKKKWKINIFKCDI